MKKNLFYVAAVALMALVSCNKEEINNSGVEPQEPQTPSVTVQFTASLEATKTSLDVENKKTVWLETDKISINGQEFEIEAIQEDGKAIFVNVNTLPEGFGAPFTAVYPYGSNGVPASQTAYANNFDPAAVIETATSEDYSLHFSNESSLLKFQVPANCSSVTLSATENLAEDSNTVTISGSMEADTDYYVAVLPGTKTNFVVRIDGYLSKDANSVTIGESAIVNMKSLPAPKECDWTVKGNFDSWGAGLKLYNDLNGNVVAKDVTLKGAFKIVNANNKYIRSISNAPTKSKWLTLYDADGDMSLTGTYDIYVNPTNKAICIVSVGGEVPVYNLSNREIYVSVEDSWGWQYLYGWKGENTEVWGKWQSRKYDLQLTISGNGYYCWKVPANFNNETISLISSKDGEQGPTLSNVKLTQDRFYKLEWTDKVEFKEVTAPTF